MAAHFHYDSTLLALNHEKKTDFETLLEKTWSERMDSGYFKYTLDDLESKTLPGKRSFVVQLNKRRFEERRKPQPIQHVNEPFQSSKFNFTKIHEREIMFKIIHKNNESEESLCLINVSPLGYGHSLLVPNADKLINQVLTLEALRLGIDSVLLASDPSIRVAFNSLCAHASVNHLHLHIWYLEHQLFVETMGASHLHANCYEMTEHEVGGYGWELDTLEQIPAVCENIIQIIEVLIRMEIAHSLFITKGKGFANKDTNVLRVLLWPRKNVTELKTENNYNIAVAELSGQVPVKGLETFDKIREEEICEAFRQERLEDKVYCQLKNEVKDILKSNTSVSL